MEERLSTRLFRQKRKNGDVYTDMEKQRKVYKLVIAEFSSQWT